MDNSIMMMLPYLMGNKNQDMGDMFKTFGGQNQNPMLSAMMSMMNNNNKKHDEKPAEPMHSKEKPFFAGNGFSPIRNFCGTSVMELLKIFLTLKR